MNEKAGRIYIGLAVFCARCHSPLRTATCDDMNGDTIDCPACEGSGMSHIGLTVRATSPELLRHAYTEMSKHKQLMLELLGERNRGDV